MVESHLCTHVYLPRPPDGFGLVDTGDASLCRRIVDALSGFDPVTHIVVARAHADHAGRLSRWVAHTSAAVWMHPGPTEGVEVAGVGFITARHVPSNDWKRCMKMSELSLTSSARVADRDFRAKRWMYRRFDR